MIAVKWTRSHWSSTEELNHIIHIVSDLPKDDEEGQMPHSLNVRSQINANVLPQLAVKRSSNEDMLCVF